MLSATLGESKIWAQTPSQKVSLGQQDDDALVQEGVQAEQGRQMGRSGAEATKRLRLEEPAAAPITGRESGYHDAGGASRSA